MSERRGLEGTGILFWDTEHTEHIAVRAAERGDTDAESLCDRVLAGVASHEQLVDLIERDDDYFEWLRRGAGRNWEIRC